MDRGTKKHGHKTVEGKEKKLVKRKQRTQQSTVGQQSTMDEEKILIIESIESDETKLATDESH